MNDATDAVPARPRPVFARHAASLIVIGGDAAAPEVLMGVRGAGHRFMPNRLVFPGGSVDPADTRAPAETEPRPHVLAMLARGARPRLARALAIAASRELAEEAGVSLGTPPRLHQLDYLCRAVTPPEMPMRFNARFLTVPAHAIEGTPADSHELGNVRFYPVADLLRENLAIVTRQVLARLEQFLALPEADRAARTAGDVFRRRRWGSE